MHIFINLCHAHNSKVGFYAAIYAIVYHIPGTVIQRIKLADVIRLTVHLEQTSTMDDSGKNSTKIVNTFHLIMHETFPINEFRKSKPII